LVSVKGVHPLSPALDTVGALAADVATAARMLGLMSGPDGATAVREPLAADVRGRRLAASPPDQLGELHPDVRRLYLEALERLRGAGVIVDMVPPLKALEDSFAPNGLIMAGEGWRRWRERIQSHRLMMD